MLTFRRCSIRAARARKALIASKTEDMLNTVVRQVAFYNSSDIAYERRKGELSPEQIGEFWMEVQTESLGPAFELTPGYSVSGCTFRISFIHRSMSTPMRLVIAW